MALPYVDGVTDSEPELSGVVLHDADRACSGLNFFHSRNRHKAYLLDMEGERLHRWSYDDSGRWNHAELLPNGDVLAVETNRSILRIDREGELVWSYEAQAHHDLWPFEDTVYTLTRHESAIPAIHPELLTLEDTVTVLSEDGEEIEAFSVYEILSNSDYSWLLHSVSHLPGEALAETPEDLLDVLHTNSIQVFDGSLVERSPLFARGNILLSVRNINVVMILDARTREILWLWGPTNLVLQHHPRLLPNGNILIFDNRRAKSRVIELDPLAQQIVWEYRDDDFFSRSRGSAQRLPNGNTLITESDPGYAFEVTPEGEVVWRFANPEISDDERTAMWRMTRVDPAALEFLPDEVRAMSSCFSGTD